MNNINSFLWLYITLSILTILSKCIFLSIGKYPRSIEYKAWHDVLSLVGAILITLWAYTLLT